MRICHRMILLYFTDLELNKKTFRYYSIFIESQGCCLMDYNVEFFIFTIRKDGWIHYSYCTY